LRDSVPQKIAFANGSLSFRIESGSKILKFGGSAMRHLRTLIGYEFQRFLVSPFFYAICALFLLLMEMVFFFSLIVYSDFPQEEPLMMQLFKSMWLPLLFIVPILTTKAIVSEKAEKLFDSLILLRVNGFSIIFSKFLAIYCVHVALWSIVIYFPEIAQHYSAPLAQFNNFVTQQIRWGGWFFINLVGGVAVAFGLWVSAFMKTPATSIVTSTVGIFLFLISGQFFRQLSAIPFGKSEIFESLYTDWMCFSRWKIFAAEFP
jgi:ABC-type transport system involved in multi-copper enzyme maturation permease subunit